MLVAMQGDNYSWTSHTAHTFGDHVKLTLAKTFFWEIYLTCELQGHTNTNIIYKTEVYCQLFSNVSPSFNHPHYYTI